MKKYINIFMVAALALFTACSQASKEPFATAGEADAPRILNTDIPEGEGGMALQLSSFERTANFNFTIIYTPVEYATVTWNIDGVDVFEGAEIDMPLTAGNHLVEVTVKTVQGLTASRSFTVAVRPAAADPVLVNDADARLVGPGTTGVLTGTAIAEVVKVYLDSREIDAHPGVEAGTLVYTVPDDMPDGEYFLYLEDAEGQRYGAVYPVLTNDGVVYQNYTVTVSASPYVRETQIRAKVGNPVILTGLNLDKVQTVSVGETAVTIDTQTSTQLIFTCPDITVGEYALTAAAADGTPVSFAGSVSANILVTKEVVLWEGSFNVTWGTPFDALKETLRDQIAVGTVLRAYVSGEGQGCFATSWWTNIETGGSGDEGRGDTPISGTQVLQMTVSQLSLDLLDAQNGFFLVGNGYTLTMLTAEGAVEPASKETTLWEGDYVVTWDTPFKELQTTFADAVKVGSLVRAYVNGEGKGCFATTWWTNIETGGSGDEGRGDTPISGEQVLSFTVSDLTLSLLAEQQGFWMVGDGYHLTKITVE